MFNFRLLTSVAVSLALVSSTIAVPSEIDVASRALSFNPVDIELAALPFDDAPVQAELPRYSFSCTCPYLRSSVPLMMVMIVVCLF